MQTDIKSFLEQIESLKPVKLSTFITSKQKEVQCEPLTFKQQKQLISTISDGLLSPLKFQKALNDIIVENVGGTDLQAVDVSLIALDLRKASVGTKVKYDGVEYDVIDAIRDRLKSAKRELSTTIAEGVVVEIETPSIEVENQILIVCMDMLKKDGEKDMGKSLSDIYTYELVKYIKSVKLGDDEVDFKLLNIKDRVNVVNTLPLAVNKKIATFIQELKNIELDAMSFEDVNGNVRYVNLDISFFDS
jgi:hypothetical protein